MHCANGPCFFHLSNRLPGSIMNNVACFLQAISFNNKKSQAFGLAFLGNDDLLIR